MIHKLCLTFFAAVFVAVLPAAASEKIYIKIHGTGELRAMDASTCAKVGTMSIFCFTAGPTTVKFINHTNGRLCAYKVENVLYNGHRGWMVQPVSVVGGAPCRYHWVNDNEINVSEH